MNKLREIFNDAGIADTRHFSLEEALAQCHRAFSYMDTHNRNQVIEHMPFVAQAAKFYGENSVACNKFENDGVLMPDEIEKQIRDSILNDQ